MNLHEYQSKELLKKYNVPVQEGIPVDSAGALGSNADAAEPATWNS
jgi:succinyl-CoA synthetase beta subunit